MNRVAVINDLSGLGKCSLTAAIPVMSVMGVQAVPLPTAVLSGQTGYGKYFCKDFTGELEQIADVWEEQELQFDGIYSGFLLNEQQAEFVLSFFQRFQRKETKILVDPVMGDNGERYRIFDSKMEEWIGQVVERAQVITPNLTEAILLGRQAGEDVWDWKAMKTCTGSKKREQAERLGILLKKAYGLEGVVITGIEFPEEDGSGKKVGNLVVTEEKTDWVVSEHIGGSYSGTGDILASVVSAAMVKGRSLAEAVGFAVNLIKKGLKDAMREGTDRNDGICFEPYLWELGREEFGHDR